MSKLRYSLFNVRNTVIFTIYDMDERFRNKTRGEENTYKAYNCIQVLSMEDPAINKDEIYLRGYDRDFDNIVCCFDFSTEEEARDYIERVDEALKEWARCWEGWDKEKEVSVKSDGIEIKEV